MIIHSGKKQSEKKMGFTLIESLVAVALFVLTMSSALGLYVVYSRSQRETGLRQEILNQITFEMEKLAQDIRLKKIIPGTPPTTASYRTGTLYDSDLADDGSVSGIVEGEYELGLLDDTGAFTIKEVYFFQKNAPANILCSGIVVQGGVYKYSGLGNLCEPILALDGVTVKDVTFFVSPAYQAFPSGNADCKTTSPATFGFNGFHCTCKQNSDCHSGFCSEENVASSVATGFCYTIQPSVTVSFVVQVDTDPNNDVVLQTTVTSRRYQ